MRRDIISSLNHRSRNSRRINTPHAKTPVLPTQNTVHVRTYNSALMSRLGRDLTVGDVVHAKFSRAPSQTPYIDANNNNDNNNNNKDDGDEGIVALPPSAHQQDRRQNMASKKGSDKGAVAPVVSQSLAHTDNTYSTDRMATKQKKVVAVIPWTNSESNGSRPRGKNVTTIPPGAVGGGGGGGKKRDSLVKVQKKLTSEDFQFICTDVDGMCVPLKDKSMLDKVTMENFHPAVKRDGTHVYVYRILGRGHDGVDNDDDDDDDDDDDEDEDDSPSAGDTYRMVEYKELRKYFTGRHGKFPESGYDPDNNRYDYKDRRRGTVNFVYWTEFFIQKRTEESLKRREKKRKTPEPPAAGSLVDSVDNNDGDGGVDLKNHPSKKERPAKKRKGMGGATTPLPSVEKISKGKKSTRATVDKSVSNKVTLDLRLTDDNDNDNDDDDDDAGGKEGEVEEFPPVKVGEPSHPMFSAASTAKGKKSPPAPTRPKKNKATTAQKKKSGGSNSAIVLEIGGQKGGGEDDGDDDVSMDELRDGDGNKMTVKEWATLYCICPDKKARIESIVRNSGMEIFSFKGPDLHKSYSAREMETLISSFCVRDEHGDFIKLKMLSSGRQPPKGKDRTGSKSSTPPPFPSVSDRSVLETFFTCFLTSPSYVPSKEDDLRK